MGEVVVAVDGGVKVADQVDQALLEVDDEEQTVVLVEADIVKIGKGCCGRYEHRDDDGSEDLELHGGK